MHFHIVSLFPHSFDSYFAESILKRAIADKKIKISFYNPMDFCEMSKKGKLARRVDDKPYAGGPGMVLRSEPVIKAIAKAVGRKQNVQIVHFAPRGKIFTTDEAKKIATKSQKKTKAVKDIVFVCGRYEGIDSRVEQIFKGTVYSIGDYVLTGGELPAMVMIDSISRQLPGVLGESMSREEERTAATKYYTRPEVLKYKGKSYKVPAVLLSGDHKKIEEWRQENS